MMDLAQISSILSAFIFLYGAAHPDYMHKYLCKIYSWNSGWYSVGRMAISLISMILLVSDHVLAAPCIFSFAWVFVDLALAEGEKMCYSCKAHTFFFAPLSYILFVYILWRKTKHPKIILSSLSLASTAFILDVIHSTLFFRTVMLTTAKLALALCIVAASY